MVSRLGREETLVLTSVLCLMHLSAIVTESSQRQSVQDR